MRLCERPSPVRREKAEYEVRMDESAIFNWESDC